MLTLAYLGLAVLVFNMVIVTIATLGARNAKRWERGERQG